MKRDTIPQTSQYKQLRLCLSPCSAGRWMSSDRIGTIIVQGSVVIERNRNNTMTHTWSYTSGSSDTPLLGITIGDMFDQTVARYPDNEALIVRHQSIRYMYREVKEQVDRCARALMALGAEKGDRLGIWAPNCAEWTIVQLAAAKIGAILVNINPSYRLHEVEYALNQSGC